LRGDQISQTHQKRYGIGKGFITEAVPKEGTKIPKPGHDDDLKKGTKPTTPTAQFKIDVQRFQQVSCEKIET